MAHNHYYLDKQNSNTSMNLKANILYTGTVHDDPNWFNIPHSHEFCEILYVVSGTGKAIIDNTAYSIHEGDLIIINPNTIHEEKSDSSNELNLIFLAINEFQLFNLPPNFLISEDTCPVINSKKYKFKIEGYFSDLLHETSSRIDLYKEICQGLVSSLIVFILRISMATQDNAYNLLSEECKKVKDYIDNNYTSQLTLDSLSQNVYISKHHLSHIFKNETGVSPIKYLITKRISEACRLLVETDLSISYIASFVGYDDPVYFSQIFKRTKGVSPLAYRNSYES